MTKQKWTVTGIAVTIIIALIGLGFAAMSVNPPFTVPTWVPILFFIIAGLVIITIMSYLMWSLIKRIKLQSPIFFKSQKSSPALASATANKLIKQPPPRRLEHDGVLWEDGGSNGWGGVYVIGPLCPKDYTPLSLKYRDNIEAKLNFGTTISSSGGNYQLVCLQCHTTYSLGKNPKRVQESYDEVAVRIIGMRRREQ